MHNRSSCGTYMIFSRDIIVKVSISFSFCVAAACTLGHAVRSASAGSERTCQRFCKPPVDSLLSARDARGHHTCVGPNFVPVFTSMVVIVQVPYMHLGIEAAGCTTTWWPHGKHSCSNITKIPFTLACADIMTVKQSDLAAPSNHHDA